MLAYGTPLEAARARDAYMEEKGITRGYSRSSRARMRTFDFAGLRDAMRTMVEAREPEALEFRSTRYVL